MDVGAGLATKDFDGGVGEDCGSHLCVHVLADVLLGECEMESKLSSF